MRLRINTSLGSVVYLVITNVFTVKTKKLFASYHITQTVSTNSKNFSSPYDDVITLSFRRPFCTVMIGIH